MSPEDSALEAAPAVTVVTAASVDEAIILGLTRLVATRDEVNIEILDEGSRGFLGIGAREARVQLTRRAHTAPPPVHQAEPEPVVTSPQPEPVTPASKPAPPPPTPKAAPDPEPAVTAAPPSEEVVAATSAPVAQPASQPIELQEKPRAERPAGDLDRAAVEQTAREVASHLFAAFNIEYAVSWEQEDRPALWISLHGKDANVMVGPRAQTLDSIQYLFRILLHRLMDGDYNVVLDADGYRKRRQRSLESLARKMADKAIKSGRSVRMKPMPAHERRVIHMLLRKDKRVKTESAGRGRERAITITPKKEP